MSRSHLIDCGGGMKIRFLLENDTFRAWVQVERYRPGVWAVQEIKPSASGDWRTSGEVNWTNERGEPVAVTAHERRRPGIDACLRHIGPTIAETQDLLPAWKKMHRVGSSLASPAHRIYRPGNITLRSGRDVRFLARCASYAEDATRSRQTSIDHVRARLHQGRLREDICYLSATEVEDVLHDARALGLLTSTGQITEKCSTLLQQCNP